MCGCGDFYPKKETKIEMPIEVTKEFETLVTEKEDAEPIVIEIEEEVDAA